MSKCPSCESKKELVKMREIGNAFKWDNNLQEGFKKLIELIVETMMAHINVSHPCTCNKSYTGFDLAEGEEMSFSNKVITFDVTAGTRIDEACREGVDLARRLKRKTRFSFNGTPVVCSPNDRPENLERIWNSRRKDKQ